MSALKATRRSESPYRGYCAWASNSGKLLTQSHFNPRVLACLGCLLMSVSLRFQEALILTTRMYIRSGVISCPVSTDTNTSQHRKNERRSWRRPTSFSLHRHPGQKRTQKKSSRLNESGVEHRLSQDEIRIVQTSHFNAVGYSGNRSWNHVRPSLVPLDSLSGCVIDPRPVSKELAPLHGA